MKTANLYNAALMISILAWGGSAKGENWSCDIQISGKTFKQEWTVSGDRMTAANGKGFYRVVKNDAFILVAFFRKWKSATGRDHGFSNYLIIEKSTGTLIDLSDAVMNILGGSYKDISSPDVNLGHCVLAER